MKRLSLILSIAALASLAAAETPRGETINGDRHSSSDETIRQQNLIGEVTAIDPAGGNITIKTETGAVAIAVNEKTLFRRVAPGEKSLTNAQKINFSEIKIGDRVLIPNGAGGGGAQTAVGQVIVMASDAIAANQTRQQDDWRARGLSGRITALNKEKKEISIQTRGHGDSETVTVAAANAKIMRYALDSLRASEAKSGSFGEMRVGDYVRVLVSPTSDARIITAEEIISGSVARTFGTITDVNQARNEITLKTEQNNQIVTVALGKNSIVKRIPTEPAQSLMQANQQRQATSGGRPPGAPQQGNEGRGRQQAWGNLPQITISELKKDDGVMITATYGADASRLTAVYLTVGDAELLKQMQRLQNSGRLNDNMSPGLPGNVGGGNSNSDDDEP